MSQGKAGEEGGAASSDVEAASPAETLTTFVFDTCSRLSATPEEAMPQGAGGAAWSDADSRLVTRMALQRLLELATGAIRNLLRGLGEATPARRVAPLGQFADVLLSSIEAIQQLASAEFLAAEFREFPAANFRAAVEDLPEEGPERLARARNREHRVLEGQGPEASAAGGEPRWTLARSRSPPRREPRS